MVLKVVVAVTVVVVLVVVVVVAVVAVLSFLVVVGVGVVGVVVGVVVVGVVLVLVLELRASTLRRARRQRKALPSTIDISPLGAVVVCLVRLQLGTLLPYGLPSWQYIASALKDVMRNPVVPRNVQLLGARARAETGCDNAATVLTSCLCQQVRVLDAAVIRWMHVH